MRGSLGKLACTGTSSNSTKQTLISSYAFSTFAGGGGRGRGRGNSGPPNPQFTAQPPGKPDNEDAHGEADDAFLPSGVGHGRGKPIPSKPILPSFSSWMSGTNSSAGRGRTTQQPKSRSEESQNVQTKKPIFFRREDSSESIQKPQFSDSDKNAEEVILPSTLLSGLSGAGRGRTTQQPKSRSEESQNVQTKKPIFFRREDSSESIQKPQFSDSDRNAEEVILPSSLLSGLSGAGRGQTTQQPKSRSEESQAVQTKKPIFFDREDSSESTQKPQFNDSDRNPEEGILPPSLLSGLSGAGRGKPVKFSDPEERPSEENRHTRRRQDGEGSRRGGGIGQQQRSSPSPPRLSREEAVKNAVRILSPGSRDRREEAGRGRGFRGRGGRGRGGRGVQGWRGRGGRGGGRFDDSEDDFTTGLYLGDNADGERLAKSIGVESMDKLIEGFEEMSSRVLPSPVDEAYLDALHTNNLIEYEPEYLMGDFETNPDIDDKPPIPLRDALEKMKPFLMAYEGIQSQEEWEEIMKELMEKLPHMKELIDIYSGPDTVTAKQQQQELERVAKTLPDKAPKSVRKFADRAVLSLQSNPGWGFDKKCQFMDKLVWEVSQHYK